MSIQPRAFSQKVIKKANRLEPELAGRFRAGTDRLKQAVDVNTIFLAFGTGDFQAVMRLFSEDRLEEAFASMGTLQHDAFMEGGKLGAFSLNENG